MPSLDDSSHVGERTKLTDGLKTVSLKRGSLHHEIIRIRLPKVANHYGEEEIKEWHT